MNHHEIINTACSFLNVDKETLLTNATRGKEQLSDARHLCVWVLYKFTNLTTTDIGQIINRDRSVINNSVKKVAYLCRFNDKMREKVINLESRIEQLFEATPVH
jgi:chromosomal replication initiation ATPase DnaA